MKAVADQLSPWLTTRLVSLGRMGSAQRQSRTAAAAFRGECGVSGSATLSKLAREEKFDAKEGQKALAELGVDAERGDPAHM